MKVTSPDCGAEEIAAGLEPAAACKTRWSHPDAGAPARLELVLDLVLCGVLIAGLTWWGHCLHSDFSRLTLGSGLLAGGLCILCGIGRLKGRACRVVAMLSLAAVGVVLGLQALRSWQAASDGGSAHRITATLMTVLVVVTVSTLVRVARAETRQSVASRAAMTNVWPEQQHHG